MTVRQLLQSLDSQELTEWIAFDRIEAIGEAREDLRAGIVASTIANFGYRQLQKPAMPSDFMPYLEREEAKPVLLDDPDQQSALILKMVFNKG
jgi:hypothetical protein